MHSQATPGIRPMAALPRTFRRIRMELAREPRHPEGSRRHGYVFVAPLDEDGRIDARMWRMHPDDCRVVRFQPTGETVGHLVQKPDGAWMFDYDVEDDDDDETGYRFGDERFVVGEYVSLQEGAQMRTFRVLSVEQV